MFAFLKERKHSALVVLGQELLRSGDRDGAIAQWRKVIETKPDHAGDMKNGLAELLEAEKLTPQDPDIDQAIRFVNSAQK